MTPSEQTEPHPIRVLALIEAYTLTGPAKNLLELAQQAAGRSGGVPAAEISCVTFRRGRLGADPFRTACLQAGVPLTVVPERFAFDPSVLSALRRVVARQAPDIIQTHSLKSHFLVRLAGLERRYPWIAFHHGYTRTNLKVLAYNQLDRFSLPHAARVVTVCHAFDDELAHIGVRRDRISVHHNSVRPFARAASGAVARLRGDLGLPGDHPVVLCVGRLSKEKGHADLIAAFALWQQRAPSPAFLVIVGDGQERRTLQQAAEAQGIGHRVVFAGQRNDLAPFYSLADMFVLPSHSEGSPNVLLEAMAAGLPIVATAVGGVPEIVTHEREALLVPRQAPAAFALALQRLAGDEALRRRLSAGARAAAAQYTPEAHRDAILALYRDCLAARPHPAGALNSSRPLSPAGAVADKRQ